MEDFTTTFENSVATAAPIERAAFIRKTYLLLSAAILAFIAVAAVYGDAADKETAFIGSRGSYWAFQRVVRPPVPALADPWVHSPLDAFVLRHLRDAEISVMTWRPTMA